VARDGNCLFRCPSELSEDEGQLKPFKAKRDTMILCCGSVKALNPSTTIDGKAEGEGTISMLYTFIRQHYLLIFQRLYC
jgi:hypothetical protein